MGLSICSFLFLYQHTWELNFVIDLCLLYKTFLQRYLQAFFLNLSLFDGPSWKFDLGIIVLFHIYSN